MIRFEADNAGTCQSTMTIPGRVEQGTIRIGSVFTRVEGLAADLKPMQIRVERIVAYAHTLEELPQGMTGQLTVPGQGLERLGSLSFPAVLIGEG